MSAFDNVAYWHISEMGRANRMNKRIWVTIVLLVLGFSHQSLQIETTTRPFECLPELGLSEMEARSIWIGYDYGGWIVPDDLQRLPSIRNPEWEIWLRYSPSMREVYVFSFDDLEVTSMADGTRALHPCGQGAVTLAQYELILGGN